MRIYKSARTLIFLMTLTGIWGAARAEQSADHDIFVSALAEFKKYPEYFGQVTEIESYKKIELRWLDLLSERVMNARYKEFNENHLKFSREVARLADIKKKLEKRKARTALTDARNLQDLELKLATVNKELDGQKLLAFYNSINANKSARQAFATLTDEQKEKAAQVSTVASSKPVNLPGVYGGSAAERIKQKSSDKINLTPVDSEFYLTQLGKKLEKDLGGRAEYWSYDYDSDSLFVQMNKEIAKVIVKEDQGGVRYIRTTMGVGFSDLKADSKVDLGSAKGRFLTGDKKQETLFGSFPSKKDGAGKEREDDNH